jgi:apolipoprotein N-acyltransferase
MAESDPVRRSEILSVLTAFLAVGFLMFCNGRYPIAICAWLGPLFMIHFTRGGKGLVRLPLAYLGLSFAFGYQFHGMTPFAGFDYWIFSGAFGIALLLPYVADRYLGLRLEGLSRSLVFPLAFVTSEYLVSISSPFGTWGSIAYSQYESLTLLQLLSIAGLSGIGFLIAWFAAVAAALWEAGFALSKVRRECAAFALCFTAVLLYGGGRLTVFPPPITNHPCCLDHSPGCRPFFG